MKFIFYFLFFTFSLFAQETSVESQEIQNTQIKENSFIPVSDVPQKASQVMLDLKKIKKAIKESKQVSEMHTQVKPYVDSLELVIQAKNYQSIPLQNVRELQKMQSEIAVYNKQLEEWDSTLRNRIDIYDTNKAEVHRYSKLWASTHMNAIDENAPEAILKHITSVIIHIENLDNGIKKSYDESLTNSQIVSTTILKLQELSSRISKYETKAKNDIFYQNQEPLNKAFEENELSFISFVKSTDTILAEKYHELSAYFQTNPKSLSYFTITMFFIALYIAYFNYLYRKKKLFVYKSSFEKKEFFFLARPISTFLILSTLSISIIFEDKPAALGGLQLLLILIPVIRILQTTIEKNHYKHIYIFFTLYLIFIIDKNATGFTVESRILLLLMGMSLLISIVYFLKEKVLYSIKKNFLTKLGVIILVVYALLLLLATVANIYGMELLARRVVTSVLITMYTSVIFYIAYNILTAYIVIMLRRRMSSATNVLDLYATKIESTTKIIIKLFMISWWMIIVTRSMGVYPFIISTKDKFLALSWQVSDMSISVSSIFDFIFIVFMTWFIARVTKTILEIEVFARFSFPRGMPTAILTTLNYTIIIGGTIIAFSSLGISAQQFALLFGALGVGIGFGLRNIIANFVSGIIMVFERPVQIGDTIEVDKTMGSVQSIGARSSVIKTFDGSEVIIPNADFIAKEITNWTLSNEHRRKTVEFKVALDNDIEKIQELLYDVAISHPNTLKDPEPLATFKGFGEYYLEFKLYFWLEDNLIVAHSEISREIYRRLQEEGIKMPVQKTHIEKDK